jgi:hypothetical protein
MPIEIEELVIRMIVEPSPPNRQGNAGETADRRDEIVQQIVEQVMEILRQKEER